MSKKDLKYIEEKIIKTKNELNQIGIMRPGSLTLQYKVPKEKIGSYYQLSYTRNRKSRTEYIRPQYVKEIKSQIANYKKFNKLVEQLIALSIEYSKLKMKLEAM